MLDDNTEDLETQNDLEETAPEAEEQLSAEQIAELKRNAEVSSQNFERAKKAEAEKKALAEKIAILESQLSGSTGDEYVEPNSALFAQINELNTKLNRLEEGTEWKSLTEKYPVLNDKKADFDSFREDPENAGLKLATAAKAFLVENNLIGETPKRKGLEKGGGGTRVAPTSNTMSPEDLKRLRETNWKGYMKLVRSGKIELTK